MSWYLRKLMARGGYMDENNGSSDSGGGSAADAAKAATDAAAAAAKAGGEAAADAAKAAEDAAKGTKLSDEEARLLKENMKRKTQIEELSKKLGDADGILKQLEDLGGLEAIKSLVVERKDNETKALEAKGDYERLKARMAEEHSKEVKTLKQQISELNDKLGKTSSVIGDLTVGTEFSKSQFISTELTLTPTKARAIYGEFFEIEGDKVVGYDKPRGAANRTALVDQYGNAVPFDQAMRKIIDADPEKDHLLKSKVKPGAASSSSKATQQSQNQKPVDSVSKISAGLRASGVFQK